MMKLVEELNAASSLFDTALGRYLDACSEIQTYFEQTTTLNGVPRDRVLSDRIAYEVLSVASYEANIQRAKSIINRARNCSSTATSIHSLPSEILTRIFHLVVDVRPCGVKPSDHSGNKTSLPKYPDFLTHVCSRWRQLVLDLPALWSHVDLIYFHSLSQGFVDRATACVARAGDLPLDTHIRVPSSHDSSNKSTLLRFLASIAPKARSLEFTVPEPVNQFDQCILECCFANCIPGKLTQFTIADNGYYAPGFIDGGDDSVIIGREDLWYITPCKGFQDILRSVVVLQVDGIYPVWTSPAYHGLAELRLTSRSALGITITHSELCDILTSSPRLRILEIDVKIEDPLPEIMFAEAPPVHLEDLEVLDVSSLNGNQLEIFFSLLSPSQNPLQLIISYHNVTSITEAYEDTVLQFLESSNITTLCMRGYGPFPHVSQLLDLCSCLRVLVLDGFTDKEKSRVPCEPPEDYPLPTSFCLGTLYMIKCRPDLDKFGKRLQKYPVNTVIFWQGEMYRNGHPARKDEVERVLSRLCPMVTHIPRSGTNPIADWYQPRF